MDVGIFMCCMARQYIIIMKTPKYISHFATCMGHDDRHVLFPATPHSPMYIHETNANISSYFFF